MNKLLSGRFILAVTSAIAFLYMVAMKTIDPKDALAVIMLVAVFYFSKRDKKEGG